MFHTRPISVPRSATASLLERTACSRACRVCTTATGCNRDRLGHADGALLSPPPHHPPPLPPSTPPPPH
eukprot:240612-Pyramimonas_sp.AAC.1